MLGNNAAKERAESRKPKYSRFTQQELPACRLLLTPALVIQCLFVVGAVFIPLGAVCLVESNQVVEVVTRYDDACLSTLNNDTARAHFVQTAAATELQCSQRINIPQTMKPPVYVYYQLTNFYQNYRRYVKSVSESQLSGNTVTGSGLDVCKPQAYLGGNKSMPVVPCGLIAWSLFNDTYSLSLVPGGSSGANPQLLDIDSSDISWPSDRNTKFGKVGPQNFNTDPQLRGGGTLPANTTLNKAQNLQVWMRTAPLPTFRKLYGQINTELPGGSRIEASILNAYNSYTYGGQKLVVLSTASWLGGKNSFLGIAYLTVGGICLFLAVVFLLLQFTNPRPLGDTSYLSWNRKAALPSESLHPVPSDTVPDGGAPPSLIGAPSG